jgi:hypothetical protein
MILALLPFLKNKIVLYPLIAGFILLGSLFFVQSITKQRNLAIQDAFKKGFELGSKEEILKCSNKLLDLNDEFQQKLNDNVLKSKKISQSNKNKSFNDLVNSL